MNNLKATKKAEVNDQKRQVLLSASSPEKRIPKFCNNVFFSKVDGGLIMTFVVKELVGESEEEHVVIERIFVDQQHAERILETFTNSLNDDES